MPFDWKAPYSTRTKSSFHATARSRLRRLAGELGLEKGSYDIRSNKGGPAVSGEITLHHDHVYVQVSNGIMGPQKGIMIRTCEGREDYAGGQNHFVPLALLDDIPTLARRVREIVPGTRLHLIHGVEALIAMLRCDMHKGE